jgi:hypothetical protein
MLLPDATGHSGSGVVLHVPYTRLKVPAAADGLLLFGLLLLSLKVVQFGNRESAPQRLDAEANVIGMLFRQNA